MANNFITNSTTSDLKSRLTELIEHSEELKFLVGFFYFSGISELFRALTVNPDVNLKILVGLNVDRGNHGLIEHGATSVKTDHQISQDFLNNVRVGLAEPSFDTQDFYDQVGFFIEKIKNGSLQIRKTLEPNHAKVYFFQLDKSQVGKRKLFVTGSSNLTKAGLSTQNEFNVEISDYGVDEVEKYFEDLWATSVKITEYEDLKAELIRTVQEETLVRDLSPFEAFLWLLDLYVSGSAQDDSDQSLTKVMEAAGYKPYKYQIDAVKQAIQIVDQFNGVIIADVVGLGKSVIGCAIAKSLKKRGMIIAPPGLVGDKQRTTGWKGYIEEFGLFDWDVWSLGELENAAEFAKNAKDIEVVIIDEAHRFRNQDTKAYEQLKNICRGKQVVLLTATPFNNSPEDILSLLKLFVTPKNANISLDSDLAFQFAQFKSDFDRLGFIRKNWNAKDLQKKQKAATYNSHLFGSTTIDLGNVAKATKELANNIRSVIEPVTIRRNRLDLLNNPKYAQEVGDLSKVADPVEWFFELDEKQLEFYTSVIGTYFAHPDEGGRFKGAIYRPFHYEAPDLRGDNRQLTQQENLFDFMRRLLVKRFESSFGAFRQSIENFKKLTELSLTFIESHGEYILDRGLIEKIYELDADEIFQQLAEYEDRISQGGYPKNHKRYKLSEFLDPSAFLEDIKSDIYLFDEILERLSELDLIEDDPKTQCLLNNIASLVNGTPKAGEPRRKLVIFSEYVDTIKYLEPAIRRVYGDRLLVIDGSLTKASILALNSNFDAAFNNPVDDYDIVLTSDRISEGFNLNRAGAVINYDIPWNPVRVIQRLGRINRISKKVFDQLFIVNFFPTALGSDLVKSREIAANKMFLIHSALGEDSKIFDIDEEPNEAGLFKRLSSNPETAEKESFFTRAARELKEYKDKYPSLFDNLTTLPNRLKVAKAGITDSMLVFFRKATLHIYAKATADTNSPVTSKRFDEIYDQIKCDPSERALTWNTDEFWENYSSIVSYRQNPSTTANEQSLESKALIRLEAVLKNSSTPVQLKNFAITLRKDIVDFGTLPSFTLRRIADVELDGNGLGEILSELGEKYLDLETHRFHDLEREVVLAIENRANG